MTAVRNLISDLVARRLWPVAVVLLVGLAAVPVALKGNAAEPATIPTADANQPVEGTSPAVSLADDAPRGGKSTVGRNPFRQKQVAPAGSRTTSDVTTVTEVPTGGSAGDSTGDTVSGGSFGTDITASVPGLDDVVPVGGGTTTGTGTTTASKPDARDAYTVDLRFGQDGKLGARNDVPRLSPLPSASDPFFVFLGVLADGKTALFLVSSDAAATGDGKCLPSLSNCERVEMQAGDTEFFDVTTPEGKTVQYQLDLLRVARERKATAAVAAAARARESAEGRAVLRTAVDTGQVEISDLAYSRDMGLVVPNGEGQEKAGSLFGGYRVDLQFGAPGALVKRYNLARLTPLPSVESPSFVYLGVLGDGETAMFLNPSDAPASGDAVCDPSPEQCDRVSLKAGNSASFDVATLDGATTRYQLDVDAITPVQVDTEAEAEAARNRESKAGRVILRRLIHEVGSLVADLSFSSKQAAVVPVNPPQSPEVETVTPPTPGDKVQPAGITVEDAAGAAGGPADD